MVPFYEAVAILYPLGHNYRAQSVDLWAYIFFFDPWPYAIIYTTPIFLLGYAKTRLSFMLLIEARPLGLGQVSIDSRTLKSARLKTKILVSSTMIHRSGLILTAFTSLLQLVSMIHLSWAELSIQNYNHPRS